ncbi:hypothetical protein QWY99_08290 [Flavobacterium branchiarum]|uniref:Tetratricopeptide repeat protein n=1 Tax=Flavobacterium branchiarum TaxID=1114870 RepID=A0ABV5FRI3_9FLAO|nr:hypothetical protein [Flavobacterium branchiarum]MDN3673044.1 hypothetical protein [Flavobacterium branchiarum]
MITKITIISMALLLLSNCSNKVKSNPNPTVINNKTEDDFSDCKKIYKKFNNKFALEENDSALIYINQAIKCNPKSSNYKFTKVRFLVETKNYNDAIIQLDELIINSEDPAFKMEKGTIFLKINEKNAIKALRDAYNDYDKIQNPTSNNQFCKIALDNYFKGKEYALKEIDKFKENYKDKGYENQNINFLEELINKETKENVLFKLFSIND